MNVIGLFPELLSSGGVQRVGRHVASALVAYAERYEHRYCIVTINDPQGIHTQKVGGQAFHFRGYGRAKLPLALRALRLGLARHPIVIAAHPNLVALVLTMKALAPQLKSIVLTHGIEVWKPLDYVRQQGLRRADLVLAPSADTARKLVNVQGVPVERVRHLPWGLDPDFLRVTSEQGEFQDLTPPLPKGRLVLTVGRLAANERYKGVDILIESLPRVLSRVPDLHLVVVGDGDDRARLEELAKAKDLAGRVHFLGHLSEHELVTCYRRCTLFAMPSRGEGFGLVYLEAMALGKPVVGPNYGAPAEFIRNNEHGLLVDPQDSEAVARALIELLTSPERALRMGQAARDWVTAEYSFDRFRDRFCRLLSDHFAH